MFLERQIRQGLYHRKIHVLMWTCRMKKLVQLWLMPLTIALFCKTEMAKLHWILVRRSGQWRHVYWVLLQVYTQDRCFMTNPGVGQISIHFEYLWQLKNLKSYCHKCKYIIMHCIVFHCIWDQCNYSCELFVCAIFNSCNNLTFHLQNLWKYETIKNIHLCIKSSCIVDTSSLRICSYGHSSLDLNLSEHLMSHCYTNKIYDLDGFFCILHVEEFFWWNTSLLILMES